MSAKPAFALSKSAFLSFTFANASATSFGVALSFAITASASLTAASAASFAAVYTPAVEVVFPPVGSSSFVCVSNAVFASVSAALSALSTNFAFSSANFAFNASTFACANAASACVLLSASATIAAASCFAAAIAVWSFPTSALYASAVSFVFPFNASSSNTVKSASACPNAVFCSSVTLSAKPAFALSKSAFLSLIAISASNTSDLVTSSLSITFCASFISFFPASLAFVYAANELEVLSAGSASSVNFLNFAIASVKAPLSTSSFF